MIPLHVPLLFCLSVGLAAASGRSSGNGIYTITTEANTGGGRLKGGPSQIYQIDASVDGVIGLATGVPALVLKAGYAGQLYDMTALVVTATPPAVAETTTSQLSGVALLDDSTSLVLSSAAIAWSGSVAPVAAISNMGVATTSNVYQNTDATLQGIFQGHSDTVLLTVLNTGADDFGSYAADQLDDAWQVLYFGQPPLMANPQFAGFGDPDGDGQNNRFEFIVGLNPIVADSRFKVRIEPVAGEPGQTRLTFGPLLIGRIYTVQSRSDLGPGPWTNLDSFPGNGDFEHIFTDSTPASLKFYRIDISKP